MGPTMIEWLRKYAAPTQSLGVYSVWVSVWDWQKQEWPPAEIIRNFDGLIDAYQDL